MAGAEKMSPLCVKSPKGIDLLNARLTLNGRELEVCGMAAQTYEDGLLWQWWIVMEYEDQKKQA